jgi:hypothetical protein
LHHRKGAVFATGRYKIGITFKKGKPVALTTGEGKVPQAVAKIGSQEILQQPCPIRFPHDGDIFLAVFWLMLTRLTNIHSIPLSSSE